MFQTWSDECGIRFRPEKRVRIGMTIHLAVDDGDCFDREGTRSSQRTGNRFGGFVLLDANMEAPIGAADHLLQGKGARGEGSGLEGRGFGSNW